MSKANGIVEGARIQHVVGTAEERVLGALFFEPSWAVPELRDELAVEDFDNPLLGGIYREVMALYDETGSVDSLVVARRIDLNAVGGLVYLDELAKGVASAKNAPLHAKMIREAAERRRQVETLREAERQIEAGRELLPELRSRLSALSVTRATETQGAHPVELGDLLAMKLLPRQWLLTGLLQKRDLGLIHAFRGIGKSRFVHSLAVAASSGGTFLRYSAPEPQSVLLVDGELPREDLQKMLAQAVAAGDKEPGAPLHILSADLSGEPLHSLATDAGRAQIERHLDGVSLLILDAITTLCPGAGPENDSQSWETMQSWLLELRRQDVTVLLVHHDGKSGVQRGTSKREDVLSQIVQLKRPSDYRASEGARFEVHLTKSRGITGDDAEPFEAWLRTGPEGQSQWMLRLIEDAMAAAVKALADEGYSQREIAKELDKGVATVNRALKRAKEAGA